MKKFKCHKCQEQLTAEVLDDRDVFIKDGKVSVGGPNVDIKVACSKCGTKPPTDIIHRVSEAYLRRIDGCDEASDLEVMVDKEHFTRILGEDEVSTARKVLTDTADSINEADPRIACLLMIAAKHLTSKQVDMLAQVGLVGKMMDYGTLTDEMEMQLYERITR